MQNKSYDALREELSDISFCCYNGILFGWPAGQPAPNDFISCFPIIGLQINTSPVLSNDISNHLTNSFAQVTFLYQHHKKEKDDSVSSHWEEWPNKLMSHELNSFLLPSISSKAERLQKINHTFCKQTKKCGDRLMLTILELGWEITCSPHFKIKETTAQQWWSNLCNQVDLWYTLWQIYWKSSGATKICGIVSS